MNYSELKRNVERKGIKLWCTHSVNLTAMTGTLTCDWHGNIGDKIQYKLKLSPEYVSMCKKLDALRLCSVRFEDKGDYLIAYPDYSFNSNGWIFISSEYRMNRYSIGYRTHILYNGEILETDDSAVPYYYKDCWKNPEAFVGMWKNKLVYRSYDSIFMISKDGIIKFVGEYPSDAESDKVKLSIKDDIVNLSVYMYWDCDHHHGDWEDFHYDLKKIA